MVVTFDEMDALRSRYGHGREPTPTDAQKMASKILAHTQADPLAQRWVDYTVRNPGRNRVSTTADVLGERSLWMGTLCLPQDVFVDGSLSFIHRVSLAVTLTLAIPFLWRSAPHNLARTLPVPSHIISRDVLPFPMMYWTYETGYGALTATNNNTTIDTTSWLVDGLVIADAGNGMNIVHFGSTGTKMIAIATGVEYGKRYPDDIPEYQMPAISDVLAMLSFLASPFIPKTQARISRHERRSLKLVGKVTEELVTFIDLRAEEHHHDRPETDHHEVNWKSRWIVRGHHRAQWYPSLNAHRLVYIAPYLKGPGDLPVKVSTYRVKR